MASEMTTLVPRVFLGQAKKGHCGMTADTGDCTVGSQGSFSAKWPWGKKLEDSPQSLRLATKWCLARCESCGACNYISVSLKFKDCSWYRSCDTSKLEMPPDRNWSSFVSGGAFSRLPRQAAAALEWPRAQTREARQALRLPVADTKALPWVQPHGSMRVALVLYGKVGSFKAPSSMTRADERNTESGTHVLRHAHRTWARHVAAANPRATFEAFAHSWSPEVGELIDELWAPKWSLHEEPRMRQFGSDVGASAAGSMASALDAKASAEQAANATYDLVWAMRYDLLFLQPVPLASLPRAQLWLPSQCCDWEPDPVLSPGFVPPSVRTAVGRAEHECLGGLVHVVDACRVSHFLRAGGRKTDRLIRDAERNYFINDWFFVAPSATADTWGGLHHRHSAYAAALREVGIPLTWQHFMWAAHVHHALRIGAGVRPLLDVGVSFTLARLAKTRRCATGANLASLLPPIAEPLRPGMAQLCARRGEVRCSLESKRCAIDAQFDPLPAPPPLNVSSPADAPTPPQRSPRTSRGKAGGKKQGGANSARRQKVGESGLPTLI